VEIPTVRTVAVEQAPSIAQNVLIYAVLLGSVLVIQAAAGAYTSERSSYPDEAAHFMNALLVRDYIREGLTQNPIRFAEAYYLHYPKIAPGMWPPLFAISAGLVMLLGWAPQTALMILLAVVNAWAGWRLYRFILSFGSPRAAVVLAGMLCLIPAVVDLTTVAMVDLLILALALEATYWLARFFSTGENRYAILFGLFSALCCLTKGNGLALALMPPFLVIFTRRPDRLAQRGLYLAAAIVVVFAGPPLALSFRLDSAIGDFGPVHLRNVMERGFFYLGDLPLQLGWLVAGLSLLGFMVAIRTGVRSHLSASAVNPAALAALVLAGITFHLLSPHEGSAHRYIAMVFPPLLGLAGLGIDQIARHVRAESSRRLIHNTLLLAVPVTLLMVTPAFAIRLPLGAGATVDFIERSHGLPDSIMLVISDEAGEGALVSEVARRHPVPSATVIRGTKLVATDDWVGHNFRLLYDSPRALLQTLEDLHVDYLVMDYSPTAAAVPFLPQIRELVETNPDRLERVFQSDGTRQFVTYRLKYRSPGPPKPLAIPLPYSLGRVLMEQDTHAQ
jgi:hypothetical protein